MNSKISSFLKGVCFIALIGVFIVSCVSREKIVYFQGDLETLDSLASYASTIQAGDLLIITVYARNPEATRLFNQESNMTAGAGTTTKDRWQTFLVDENGEIEFPVLGKVQLAGLKRSEAITHMKELLSEEIIDPGVSLTISNFRITILGEVNKPGVINVSNDKITLLEALGQAGDLTINGVRKNVLVVREEGESRTYHRVDLTSSEFFESPVYYLKQNDVVYVEPNQSKMNSSSSTIRDVTFVMSVLSFALTLITLLTR